MKILHITPTYFSTGSVVGGGERYVEELSKKMSETEDTTLLSFGDKRVSESIGRLRIEIYPVSRVHQGLAANAFNVGCVPGILRSDIVHIHGLNTYCAVLSAIWAGLSFKNVFATDYGGGTGLGDILNNKYNIYGIYKNVIAYSEFNKKVLPGPVTDKTVVIKGGIDTARFKPKGPKAKKNNILFVGRILPHKGIDYLIRGFSAVRAEGKKLKILGKVYDEEYYNELLKISAGSDVEFIHDADDNRLIEEYNKAMVTVLPSVHVTSSGVRTEVPELMGFTLLESQACGTPVICTDAGAMSEFVENDRTGFVVGQNSPEAISYAIERFADMTDEQYSSFSGFCVDAMKKYDWDNVAGKHLEVYAKR